MEYLDTFDICGVKCYFVPLSLIHGNVVVYDTPQTAEDVIATKVALVRSHLGDVHTIYNAASGVYGIKIANVPIKDLEAFLRR